MKHTLVGYTGFVGSNLAAAHSFDGLYNSKNIQESFGADNGLVVYSGMPAEKFLANSDAAADYAVAQNAMENIRRMRPQQLVLISTVDVYPRPVGVYEDSPIEDAEATAYGKNRHALEGWVREEYPKALVVRLPGLFGQGLKKNFIYDMLTLTPSALAGEKYEALAAQQPLVATGYAPDGKGFYRLKKLPKAKAGALRDFFAANDFNALSFTDSRSVYQFYNLADLWRDIKRCLAMELGLVNLGTPPIQAGALYRALFGADFVNHTARGPVLYDMRTRYGREFGGPDGYVADGAGVLADIARFAAVSLREKP